MSAPDDARRHVFDLLSQLGQLAAGIEQDAKEHQEETERTLGLLLRREQLSTEHLVALADGREAQLVFWREHLPAIGELLRGVGEAIASVNPGRAELTAVVAGYAAFMGAVTRTLRSCEAAMRVLGETAHRLEGDQESGES